MILSLNTPKNLPQLLRECWIKLNSTFMKRVKTIGITQDQYIVLRWIHEFSEELVTQKKLAQLMCTDGNNIAGIMKRMENQGLIERKKNLLDQRKKNIFSTYKGTVLFKKGQVIAEELENEVLSCFSAEEKKHFLILLFQLSEIIDHEKCKY